MHQVETQKVIYGSTGGLVDSEQMVLSIRNIQIVR
jgi:hypothetical protein